MMEDAGCEDRAEEREAAAAAAGGGLVTAALSPDGDKPESPVQKMQHSVPVID